jgi:hypothetical protein
MALDKAGLIALSVDHFISVSGVAYQLYLVTVVPVAELMASGILKHHCVVPLVCFTITKNRPAATVEAGLIPGDLLRGRYSRLFLLLSFRAAAGGWL